MGLFDFGKGEWFILFLQLRALHPLFLHFDGYGKRNALFIGLLQQTAPFLAGGRNNLDLLVNVVKVLLQYFEGLPDACRSYFQFIILNVTVKVLINVAAQVDAVVNPDTLFVVNLHYDAVVCTNAQICKKILFSF